uniref:glutathione transferase n=1 Tax=Subpsaltria yangi TaxID=1195109 RepID=A0A2L1DGA9_9HEMI|nr:glutathione S-transferase 2 [Subpsaltria yangi]
MPSKYKLTYFTLRGLAEPIRYILAYRNIEFEDIRLDLDTWNSSVKQTSPFGKIPILEIDGKKLTQSRAICRYLAKEAGLAGKDAWEDLQIDIIVDTIDDVRYAIVDYGYFSDEKSKAAKKGPLLNETIPFYFKKFDTIVSENKGHLANKKLTWADIYFVAISEHLSLMVEKDILESYPNLKALRKTVQAYPGIKKHIEKRPADINISF